MRHPLVPAVSFLALACLTGTTSAQVAVVFSSSGGVPWGNDVRAKIEATGVDLGPVTVIDANLATPTLEQLQRFQSVLVFHDIFFPDPVAMGNRLHDYVDGGGGVVVCAYGNGWGALQGTWAAQKYGPLINGGYAQGGPMQLGERHAPNHPLFSVSPVVDFNGGSLSYINSGGLAPNSTRLADYRNGWIFAAERHGLNGRVLSLNFYPPSERVQAGLWHSSTDGDNLMANALDYVGNCPEPIIYCTAKVNSLGCTPAIGYQGTASAASGSGFVLQGANVRNRKPGLLLYGVDGRASGAFQGGTLCVKTPIRRTPVTNSGGTPLPQSDCSGVYSIDMNAFAVGALGGTPLAPLRIAGTVVDCQWWGRDPGYSPPNNTTLTDAIEYVICP